MTKIKYIGFHNPREEMDVEDKKAKELIATGNYEVVNKIEEPKKEEPKKEVSKKIITNSKHKNG